LASAGSFFAGSSFDSAVRTEIGSSARNATAISRRAMGNRRVVMMNAGLAAMRIGLLPILPRQPLHFPQHLTETQEHTDLTCGRTYFC
jgi:hypothetical protein